MACFSKWGEAVVLVMVADLFGAVITWALALVTMNLGGCKNLLTLFDFMQQGLAAGRENIEHIWQSFNEFIPGLTRSEGTFRIPPKIHTSSLS